MFNCVFIFDDANSGYRHTGCRHFYIRLVIDVLANIKVFFFPNVIFLFNQFPDVNEKHFKEACAFQKPNCAIIKRLLIKFKKSIFWGS